MHKRVRNSIAVSGGVLFLLTVGLVAFRSPSAVASPGGGIRPPRDERDGLPRAKPRPVGGSLSSVASSPVTRCRTGRQDDALATYKRVRTQLADEHSPPTRPKGSKDKGPARGDSERPVRTVGASIRR
jgi:hypothetical protein